MLFIEVAILIGRVAFPNEGHSLSVPRTVQQTRPHRAVIRPLRQLDFH